MPMVVGTTCSRHAPSGGQVSSSQLMLATDQERIRFAAFVQEAVWSARRIRPDAIALRGPHKLFHDELQNCHPLDCLGALAQLDVLPCFSWRRVVVAGIRCCRPWLRSRRCTGRVPNVQRGRVRVGRRSGARFRSVFRAHCGGTTSGAPTDTRCSAIAPTTQDAGSNATRARLLCLQGHLLTISVHEKWSAKQRARGPRCVASPSIVARGEGKGRGQTRTNDNGCTSTQ
mmetsp:Transcript_22789/g.69721  ORF Transcript_22789/g.69721 Transcript_22789/m.69721 type:complete len:229 (+) Transcript_22789:2132-2818(+)